MHRKISRPGFSPIAYNLCKNDYRHLDVVKRFAEDLRYEESIVEETTENRESQLQDFSKLIFEEIKQEDTEHKTCFLLFYREGFTLDEIQECTNTSIGTIKSRLYYTRKRLKNRLEKKYPELIKNLQYEF
jgi:RNA polymerase sigma-70 factor (ECF subfamily)